MLRFIPTINYSNPWYNDGVVEVATFEELERFFVYWNNNPFKKRIFIDEDERIKFQYSDLVYGRIIELGRICQNNVKI